MLRFRSQMSQDSAARFTTVSCPSVLLLPLSLVIKWKLRQGQLRTRPFRQRLFHSSWLHVGLDASRDHVHLLTASLIFLLQTRHLKLCVVVESVLWLLHIAQRILGVSSLVLILDS